MKPHIPAFTDSLDDAASQWLAKRDRGLTPVEQDAYLQWLRADARHAEAMARHAAALERLMHLGEWQPALSSEPNPDLFAPVSRRRWTAWTGALAAAAAIALATVIWWPKSEAPTAAAAPKSHLRVNERQALADGSLVELKDGTRFEVLFTESERRLRLIEGEAHFTVARNPDRPFIVQAGGVAVRAVGTAFNVRLSADNVEVLVTHGRVQVDAPTATALPELTMGERATVSLAAVSEAVQLARLSPVQVREELAWQAPRLQFYETPLADAVAEFNRHSGSRRLVLRSPELGAVPIGGTFRVDNVEGFVRLLDITLDIRGEERGGEIVLDRAR